MPFPNCSHPGCTNPSDTAGLFLSPTGDVSELFACNIHHQLFGVEYDTPSAAEVFPVGDRYEECKFQAMIFSTNYEHITVVLKGIKSQCVFLSFIGYVECCQLYNLAKRVSCSMPQIHHLLLDVICRLDAFPKEAVIDAYDRTAQAFRCVLAIAVKSVEIRVPCRVSDAICLSIAADFPIKIHEAFLGKEQRQSFG